MSHRIDPLFKAKEQPKHEEETAQVHNFVALRSPNVLRPTRPDSFWKHPEPSLCGQIVRSALSSYENIFSQGSGNHALSILVARKA